MSKLRLNMMMSLDGFVASPDGIGATVMGRNMFGGGPGPWGDGFHFVTDGIESALEQAKDAAAGKDVSLGGGATAGDAPALPRSRRRSTPLSTRLDGGARHPLPLVATTDISGR